MNELNELAIIRLQTELENAIGFREYFLRENDLHSYATWDQTLDDIINEIMNLENDYGSSR
jgi:hypothetical protein